MLALARHYEIYDIVAAVVAAMTVKVCSSTFKAQSFTG
jgi:hypothetical protein